MHPADALTERLGLPVHDRDLLAQALVHSSWLHEHPDAARGHNERLEFLGDAVVSLAVSEALYRRHPADDEGVLSARRAAIVSTPGPRPAGRPGSTSARTCCSARARRSAAGASGRPCWRRRSRRWSARSTSTSAGTRPATGSTSWRRRSSPPTTRSRRSRAPRAGSRSTPSGRPASGRSTAWSRRSGPDHEKQFRIEVEVDGRMLGVGEGPSRRIAETVGRGPGARGAPAASGARRARRAAPDAERRPTRDAELGRRRRRRATPP